MIRNTNRKSYVIYRNVTLLTTLGDLTVISVTENLPSAHHRTTLSGYIFATKAHIDNRKKTCQTLNSNISPTCPYNMVNYGPLAAEIGSLVWRIPANFNGFRVLAALLQRHRSTEAKPTLHNVWPSSALVHYIYIFDGFCHVTEFCQVKFTLRPSLALSYIVSVTAQCTVLE